MAHAVGEHTGETMQSTYPPPPPMLFTCLNATWLRAAATDCPGATGATEGKQQGARVGGTQMALWLPAPPPSPQISKLQR